MWAADNDMITLWMDSAQGYWDHNCYWYRNEGEAISEITFQGYRMLSLSEWVAWSDSAYGLDTRFGSKGGGYDSNSVNINPYLGDDLKMTDNTPAAIKTGGRGGAYPSYMGAFAPVASCPPPGSTEGSAPANGTVYTVTAITSQEDIVRLEWLPSAEADRYRVEIADNSSMTNPTIVVTVDTTFYYAGGYGSDHLADGTGTTHYWHVIVVSDACGYSQPSATKSFVLVDEAVPDWPE